MNASSRCRPTCRATARRDGVIDAAIAAFGRVDILVTNTGGPPPVLRDHDTEAWRAAVRS